MLEMFILLSVVGAFAGLLAGLFGVGGGMVLVPAFFYSFTGLGYAGADTMQVCLATSLATIVVTSLRSLISHHRQAGVDWELLKLWAPGIALGAVFGVLFATQLRSITLQWIFWRFWFAYWILYGFWPLRLEPWFEDAIGMGAGAFIAADWIHISFDGHWWWQSGRAADDASWKNHSSSRCHLIRLWFVDCSAVGGVFLLC